MKMKYVIFAATVALLLLVLGCYRTYGYIHSSNKKGPVKIDPLEAFTSGKYCLDADSGVRWTGEDGKTRPSDIYDKGERVASKKMNCDSMRKLQLTNEIAGQEKYIDNADTTMVKASDVERLVNKLNFVEKRIKEKSSKAKEKAINLERQLQEDREKKKT